MYPTLRWGLISLAGAAAAFLLGTVICSESSYDSDLFGFGAVLVFFVAPGLLLVAGGLFLIAIVQYFTRRT